MRARNDDTRGETGVSLTLSKRNFCSECNIERIKLLPVELYDSILGFLNVEDRIQWTSCTRGWYRQFMKDKIRIVKITQFRNLDHNINDIMKRFPLLIKDPYSQLNITFGGTSFDWFELPPISNLFDLIKGFACKVSSLSINAHNFAELLKRIDILNIKHLSVSGEFDLDSDNDNDNGDNNSVVDALCKKVHNLVKLDLSLKHNSIQLPYISSLQSLTISNFIGTTRPMDSLYLSQLHTLRVCNCALRDVSALGGIPDLMLLNCSNFTDISSLNRNEKIAIQWCDSITDYSKSFQNSRVVSIGSNRNCTIDLSHYQQVRKLTMQCVKGFLNVVSLKTNRIPYSLKRCHLYGAFAQVLNLEITDHHQLEELAITSDHSIASFEGLGFERLSVISCTDLSRLSTTKGLGGGRNRKITLYGCNAIQDFTSLQNVPELIINGCNNFHRLSDVSNVRTLDLCNRTPLTFAAESLLHLQTFSINDYANPIVASFSGLEKIPHLVLRGKSIETFCVFVKDGGQTQNQSIKIATYFSANMSEVIELYHHYLAHAYLLSRRDSFVLFLRR